MKKSNPVFRFIDVDNWARKPYFDHYYHTAKCTYSITADIDIGSLLTTCKKKSIKLYPAMLHIISTAANQMEELRTSYDNQGKLGVWDFMSPSYTVFHKDDKTFSHIWTSYNQDFSVFYRDYLYDIETYGNRKDFFAKGSAPGNIFPVSSIPWIDFTGFNLNIFNGGDFLLPIFTMGKYGPRNNQTVIPLSVQVHHALCDGYHVGILFELIRELASKSDKWM